MAIVPEQVDQALQAALGHHQAGRLGEAEKIYRGILDCQPSHADALHLLGVLRGQRGDGEQAVNLISRAIASDSGVAAFHNNLGNVLCSAGRMKEAISAYQRAVDLQSNYAEAFNNLGNALSDAGRLSEAIEAYSTAIGQRPNYAEAYTNLGTALKDQMRLAEAIEAHKKAIQLNPDFAEAYNNLGIALRENNQTDEAIAAHLTSVRFQPSSAVANNNLGVALRSAGRVDEAVAAYRQAIQLKPDYAEAFNNLGNALSDQGLLDEAIAELEHAIKLAPRYAEAYNNLGTVLRNYKRAEEAIAAYKAAIQIVPLFAEAFSNMGVALHDQGKLAESIAAWRKAIQIKPDYAQAHANLGVSLCNAGKKEEAIAECRLAVELNPGYGPAHSNLGLILLRLGEYEDGWAEHEWRFQCDERYRPRPFAQPQWRGEELKGRRILLHAEQGFGDTMQFARYAPLVAERGGRVILECHRELRGILGDLAGVEQLLGRGEALPEFDLQCSLMSLPLAFGTTVNTVPANVPYLSARADDAKAWQARFDSTDRRLKVGLVWAGRPLHSNDRNRSMRLDLLAPLAGVQGVNFVSLQKGPAASQAAAPPRGLSLIDWTSELTNFTDTAALIANLDLVIAVDTAVAHLAGAMGKPVWVMLAFVPDWRWMQDRADSPWYPTMRLFRQERWGDWEGVVERVAGALPSFPLSL